MPRLVTRLAALLLAILAPALSPPAALAEGLAVSPCSDHAWHAALPPPAAADMRTYYQGEVEVATTATASGMQMVIGMPGAGGVRDCKVVNLGGGDGFARLFAYSFEASYNPATGLRIVFDYAVPQSPGDAIEVDWFRGAVTLNLATGQVAAETVE